MKVVIVTPWMSRAGGGVAEAARIQALSLSTSEDVTVLTLKDEHSDRDRSGWDGVDLVEVRRLGSARYGFAPRLIPALLRTKPDVVHVHGLWQFHCAAVYLWSVLTRRPYIVSPHGMLEPWILARSHRVKAIVSWLYQFRFLKRAAAFHVLTEQERKDVAEFAGDRPVEIIPNAVAPGQSDGKRPSWWRDEFEGKTIFLFLGRLHRKKGCLELCEAWDSVCQTHTEFRERSLLVFCGWNDGLPELDELVTQLQARHGNVVLAGPRYGVEKSRSLGIADFFVLPSRSEGLPIAVLEAWAQGITVIMTAECNLSIGFERQAALVCGAEPSSIASVLLDAFKMEKSERDRMGSNGQGLVAERFAPSRIAERMLRLLRGVVEKQGDQSSANAGEVEQP